ncbi:hypothetical protein PENTCL1PPCAC_19456, partial [Pristionchus entomophagus]
EIYLVCSCGEEVRSQKSNPNHIKKCNGLQFTLHKLDKTVPTTPQCIQCEAYPTTARCYAKHLRRQHKSSMKANGIYLICSCGLKIRSDTGNSDHSKKCDGKQYTLHKLDDK